MTRSHIVALYRVYKRILAPSSFQIRRFIASTRRRAGVPAANVCLDIGAGIAPYRRHISSYFSVSHYIALDFTPSDAIDVVAEADALPIRDSSVDLVVCFEVLQSVAPYGTALDEMVRVLRPGGHVIVSFPFMYGECDVVDLRRWTIAGMTKELERRGFAVLSYKRRGGLLMTFVMALIRGIQQAIPGARRTWRSPRTGIAYVREGALALLTFPLYVINWVALAVDNLLPASGCYVGALIFAQLAHRKDPKLGSAKDPVMVPSP
jgi:SAM-dependent methyltransferase